jgi:ABC-type xylose transport system substrate-binding protein
MSDTRDKVHVLKREDTSALAAAVEQMKRDRELIIAHHRELAAIQRQAYLAYTREGFTPAQALELVKSIR